MGFLLAVILFLLLSNPRKEEVLVCEVRASFQSRIEMNFQSEGELECLNGCVREGLRFYAPASSAIPYLALAGGMIVDGVFISHQNESAASCWPPPCVLIRFPQSAVSVHHIRIQRATLSSFPRIPRKSSQSAGWDIPSTHRMIEESPNLLATVQAHAFGK